MGENGKPFATVEDLVIRRDEDGRVIPLEVEVSGVGLMIRFRPLTLGAVLTFKEPGKPVVDWPLDDKVRLLREHVIEPDLSKLTAQEVRERWDHWTFDRLCSTVAMYSGPLRRSAKLVPFGESGDGEATEAPSPSTST